MIHYYIRTALLAFKHEASCHALASSNAHRDDEHLLISSAELTEASDNLSRTRGSERVTEGNGTTTRVHLGPVQAELVTAVDSHRGKGLIDLKDIDVGNGKVKLGEELGDGIAGADAHYAGRQAGNGRADVLGEDGLAELDSGRALHEENGSSY